jgi:hypothetical protein
MTYLDEETGAIFKDELYLLEKDPKWNEKKKNID